MIDIKILFNNDKIIKKLEVKGHSKFDRPGKDIVCAAVSILIYSAYLSIKNLPDIKIEYKDDKENIYLSLIDYKKELEGEIRGITIFLVNGLKLLSENYKNNVNLDLIEN